MLGDVRHTRLREIIAIGVDSALLYAITHIPSIRLYEREKYSQAT